jgi:hypothetical protein
MIMLKHGVTCYTIMIMLKHVCNTILILKVGVRLGPPLFVFHQPLCHLWMHLFSTPGVSLLMRDAGAGDSMINHLLLSMCPPWDHALALWKLILKIEIRLSTILLVVSVLHLVCRMNLVTPHRHYIFTSQYSPVTVIIVNNPNWCSLHLQYPHQFYQYPPPPTVPPTALPQSMLFVVRPTLIPVSVLTPLRPPMVVPSEVPFQIGFPMVVPFDFPSDSVSFETHSNSMSPGVHFVPF